MAATEALSKTAPADDVAININLGPSISQTLPVPKRFVGYLVGVKGRTLKGIQKGSSTKIFIQENSKDEEWCYVHINGTSRAINRAKKIIVNALIRACTSDGDKKKSEPVAEKKKEKDSEKVNTHNKD